MRLVTQRSLSKQTTHHYLILRHCRTRHKKPSSDSPLVPPGSSLACPATLSRARVKRQGDAQAVSGGKGDGDGTTATRRLVGRERQAALHRRRLPSTRQTRQATQAR